MNRRLAIKKGSMALVGLGLGACRTSSSLDVATERARRATHLAPVIASWDRVLRTTVGLRPHRKSGFVLRAEKLGEKLLIHNYGHAGAGMSIAWGCGVVASEFALQANGRRVAVIVTEPFSLRTARDDTSPLTNVERWVYSPWARMLITW